MMLLNKVDERRKEKMKFIDKKIKVQEILNESNATRIFSHWLSVPRMTTTNIPLKFLVNQKIMRFVKI